MKNLLIIAVFTVYFQNVTAQDAMSLLIAQNLNDESTLQRIDEFRLGGYQQLFDSGSHNRDEFISTAKAYLGTPYKFGGISDSGMDCSGLIFRTMSDLGLPAPHGAQELARFGQIILDKNDLKPGDVIFFTKTYTTDKLVTHAAFVIEDNQMIHASTSRGVQIIPIDDPYYWNEHYLFGTRIFALISDVPLLDNTDVVTPAAAAAY